MNWRGRSATAISTETYSGCGERPSKIFYANNFLLTRPSTRHSGNRFASAVNKDNPAKHFILAFIIALVLYAISYSWIEHRRTRNGPWELTFTSTTDAFPEVIINQKKLRIANVHIVFGKTAVTNASEWLRTMSFAVPRQVPYDLPFGKCIFMDTTFLPGTLTCSFFGHEIEFLPRVMIIDHQEHGWKPDEVIMLRPAK